jgi:hypothetical protein
MKDYKDIPVVVMQSRIISIGELHASISICIRSTDFSRGPRHGVDSLVSWSSQETKFWRISSRATSNSETWRNENFDAGDPDTLLTANEIPNLMVYNVPNIKINITLQSKQHNRVSIIVWWVYTQNYLKDKIEIECCDQKEDLNFILELM